MNHSLLTFLALALLSQLNGTNKNLGVKKRKECSHCYPKRLTDHLGCGFLFWDAGSPLTAAHCHD